MPTSEKTFRAPCGECGHPTRHRTLCEDVTDGGEEYHCQIIHSVIQCQGCHHKSFRRLFRDFEAAYPTDREEWEVPEEVNYYPKSDFSVRDLPGLFLLPDLVEEIYKESVLAIKEGAFTLAGLGLRATIEAICNDRQIKGRDLATRISKLSTQGLISASDASLLHGIRFLGNDAAHEIKKPKQQQISAALKVIQHLIETVYILPREAAGHLDTMLTGLDEVKALVTQHLGEFSSGDEYPLAKILGRDIRRLGVDPRQMEANLISEIVAGNYTDVALGKIAVFANSSAPLQHFIVA